MKKKGKTNQKTDMRSEREVNQLVARTGLKGSARGMAEQYGKGLLDGMHIAYGAVAARLLRAGNSRAEIASFFDDLVSGSELTQLLDEAEEKERSRSV